MSPPACRDKRFPAAAAVGARIPRQPSALGASGAGCLASAAAFRVEPLTATTAVGVTKFPRPDVWCSGAGNLLPPSRYPTTVAAGERSATALLATPSRTSPSNLCVLADNCLCGAAEGRAAVVGTLSSEASLLGALGDVGCLPAQPEGTLRSEAPLLINARGCSAAMAAAAG